MMKKKNKFLPLLAVAAMLLTGCDEGNASSPVTSNNTGNSVSETSNVDSDIHRVYQAYLANGGELSYEVWLASIKGEKGDKGDTGASVRTGNGTPDVSLGNNGDSYIDLDTWDYYIKTDGTWIKEGNIKGKDCNVDPQGLDYYLLDDNTYSVGCGTATFLSQIVIPEVFNGRKVTHIIQKGFFECTNLKSITIPDSVTTIGSHAFYKCSSLASITIPDSVTEIGTYAFSGCTKLASITISKNLTAIGSYAFENCSSLASITIPDTVTEIGTYAFENCSSLASITIPDGVTKIIAYTFYGCTSLTSITIPDTVTSIGSWAFFNCIKLATITFNGTIAQWNAIIKGDYWHENVRSTTRVTCTDGTVALK